MVNDSDVVSGWMIEGGLRNRGFNSTGIYRLVGEAMSVGGMLNEEGVIGGLRNLKLIYGEAFAVCSLMCSGRSVGEVMEMIEKAGLGKISESGVKSLYQILREDDLTVDSFNAVGQELRSRKILSSKEQGERLEWQMFQCPKIEAPVLVLPSMLEEVVYRLQSQCGVKVEGEDLKTLMTEQVYDLLAAMAITVVKEAKWERYRWEKDFVNYKAGNLGKSVMQDILRFLMQPEYYWQELE